MAILSILSKSWCSAYVLCAILLQVHLSLFFFQMGGRLNVADEVLCRFDFPERPGALMKFLDAFSPQWNISLFHYRSQVG